jgi:hypothetical protein
MYEVSLADIMINKQMDSLWVAVDMDTVEQHILQYPQQGNLFSEYL